MKQLLAEGKQVVQTRLQVNSVPATGDYVSLGSFNFYFNHGVPTVDTGYIGVVQSKTEAVRRLMALFSGEPGLNFGGIDLNKLPLNWTADQQAKYVAVQVNETTLDVWHVPQGATPTPASVSASITKTAGVCNLPCLMSQGGLIGGAVTVDAGASSVQLWSNDGFICSVDWDGVAFNITGNLVLNFHAPPGCRFGSFELTTVAGNPAFSIVR